MWLLAGKGAPWGDAATSHRSLSDAAEPNRWEESVSAAHAVRQNGENALSSHPLEL